MVKAGDIIPNINLLESTPDQKVNLLQEFVTGRGIIIGVPAAFSPLCTECHIPGFIKHPKLQKAGKVFVVAVNDVFVVNAWAKYLDPEKKSHIRFLSDPCGDFTRALGLEALSSLVLGNTRSKRYTMRVKDGRVVHIAVEPDLVSVNACSAENMLDQCT